MDCTSSNGVCLCSAITHLTLWDSSTENDLRECEEKREVLKPESKILQCGIVQTIKGIFRTAPVIAELL